MQLAAERFYLKLGSEVFTLRPTLRAAFFLNQKYDGFHNLSRYIAEGSLTTASDLITETVTEKAAWASYALTDNSIVLDLMAARDQLLEFVLILMGAKQPDHAPADAKPITFEEYHTKLYQIATGWLGWTPVVAWDATPAEIINAHQGRLEMLKAIFGGRRDDTETIDVKDADARAELNALGDLSVTTMSGVR
ncbi:hypothetical protein [Bradyrhizobium sp. NP1]|uniref:hypothetical protein n=1 Tax=Bradyrhizobium sp. NP1 TaxID=3049772 RepID=UPI0025A4EDB7|nr:hypothetical protein [Bradyrhizobium sp. NP1]WJR76007.1 hypothetical protein QOU61_24965 [Bradyrhizobium sp. NP1]